ncbi:MAG: hypothetical protein V4857_27300 [Pseudomonadota bacterium]
MSAACRSDEKRFATRSLATEEWYEFGPARTGRPEYLLTADESTDKPGTAMVVHPVTW